MIRNLPWFLCTCCLLAAAAAADPAPAKGRLLVATELVRGEVFAGTVILLLRYDGSGALGLVVNRPTDVGLGELLEETDLDLEPDQLVYWGGPVEMNSLSALVRSNAPPRNADEIVESVHRIAFADAFEYASKDPASVRFYLGYAGWAAGQLDHELARGSWHVMVASDDIVFVDDPQLLWERLTPAPEYRAAAD